MKQVNGKYVPENYDDAFGSWILHTAGIMCGLCLRGKQRSGEWTVETRKEVEAKCYFIPLVDAPKYAPSATRQYKGKRWNAYKRHIKEVHNGNWNLNQGFGSLS